MSLHICILEADDLHPSLEPRFISFGEMFKRLFYRQTQAVEFQVFNVVRGEYPKLGQHFDAYLVTGSKADSFSDEAWVVRLRDYLRGSYLRGDVLLGVCFGHQILALALGGVAERSDRGWGIGVHRYQVEYKPQWLSDEVDEFQLLISHRDQVTVLPKNARLLARSDFCANAAYVIGEQVLCFQGHPEFTHDFARGLMHLRQSVYCPEVYQAACHSLACEHDGSSVARWMLAFVKAAKQSRTKISDHRSSSARNKESACTA